MIPNLLLYLLFFLFVSPAKSEYTFEEIEELVPKLVIKDEYSLFYKILKYHVPYNENSNTTNISLQFSINYFIFSMFLYDNYSKIDQDEKGLFKNYILNIELKKDFLSLENLNCDTDYYFVFFYNSIDSRNTFVYYLQIVILNEEKNVINLSPLLSEYFEIMPRNINKGEILFYYFNETKYAFIQFIKGELILTENENIIYNKSNEDFHKVFEFKKNQKYYIYYNSSTSNHIFIQFYNESKFFRYDIKKKPILLLGNFTYNIEIIDISEYDIGDYIVFQTYDSASYSYIFDLSYQYKKDFITNNFISLGTYQNFNFIPIKKAKNDSSLILKIKTYSKFSFILDIYKKSKMKEITSEIIYNIKGPQLFLVDYYRINNLNSFGIESNTNYIFFQQNLAYQISMRERDFRNITIYKYDYFNPYIFQRVFIYINSNKFIFLKFQNFNFTIYNFHVSNYFLQYFPICTGGNSPKELYFYLSYRILDKIMMFTPVFGNYDIFFIHEKEMKDLSDFNFNNNNKRDTIFIQNSYDNGYLKIKCQNPTIVRYFKGELYSYFYSYSNLESGFSYIICLNKYILSFTLERTLINKIISLKYTFGI